MEKHDLDQSVLEKTELEKTELERLAYAYEHGQGLEVPEVTWWKDPGLRKLYIMMPILFLGSTLNGYDGSLLNGLQTMEPWQSCRLHFDGPQRPWLTLI